MCFVISAVSATSDFLQNAYCSLVNLRAGPSMRDYRGADLRNKLEQRLSPQQRYSPGKDASGRHSFRGQQSCPYNLAASFPHTVVFLSPLLSLAMDGESSALNLLVHLDRKRRKKQQYDGQSDFSGSLKVSDRADDRVKERKSASFELEEMQSKINKLEHHKTELMISLEKKAEEADSLTSKVQELEAQLSAEKEDCKRITSNIKKFVKAYKHYVWAQDELNRHDISSRDLSVSEVRFKKLGDQLLSGTATDCNEEDSNINIVNNGETNSHCEISTQNEMQKQNNSSPIEKSLGGKQYTAEKLTQGNLTTDGHRAETLRLSKLSQFHSHPVQLNSHEEFEVADHRNGSHWPIGNEGKQKKGKSVSTRIPSDKAKGSGSVLLVPSTSMAARVIDEPAEIEMEEHVEVVENISLVGVKGRATYEARSLPFSLPHLLQSLEIPIQRLVLQSWSPLYEGEDENVDVGGLEEGMVDADIV
ncbi:unnamed protein product [Dovyalis caffra]|uniref:Uncharacterized protein n=1 Tax=Dovyalis caffra TaxID=77055 RepID=A0AAV1RDE1_9ROSI|nr:unnamed protein product [Dovyalis caffra]